MVMYHVSYMVVKWDGVSGQCNCKKAYDSVRRGSCVMF